MHMRIQLSIQSLLAIAGIGVALAVLLVFAHTPEHTNTAETNSDTPTTTAPTTTRYTIDTDGDGLKDWEETLWGTDPEVADSDADGTTDGAEVDAGRDPTIAAPDDTLAHNPSIPAYTSTQEVSDTPSENTGNEDQTDAARNQTEEQEPTDPALVTYGNTFGALIDTHLQTAGADAELLQTLIDTVQATNTPIRPDIILPMKQRHDRFARTARKITVPDTFSYSPYNMVSVYAELADTVTKLTESDATEETVLDHMEAYNTAVKGWVDAFMALRRYYQEHNIVFQPEEPGYIFTQSF